MSVLLTDKHWLLKLGVEVLGVNLLHFVLPAVEAVESNEIVQCLMQLLVLVDRVLLMLMFRDEK